MTRKWWNKLKMEYIFWFARRLPPCNEILPLISQRMDRKLPWRRRVTLLLHNHICIWCKNYARQLLLIRETLQHQEAHPESAPLSESALPLDARDRMKRALGQ